MQEILAKRPLSWSAISSFQYDQEQWYRRYVLGEKQEENATMRFGRKVGERLASDPLFMPEILRPEGGVYEKELRFTVGDIPMIGFIDWYHPTHKNLKEFKTGKSWDKKKAENHGQLKLYSLGLMLLENVKPEDLLIELISMESEAKGDFSYDFVKDMKPKVYKVDLTTKDCLLFGAEILQIVKEMQAYVDSKTCIQSESQIH